MNLSHWKTVWGTTIYLYDDANVLEEVDNTGNVLARYTQPGQIDEPLAELRGAAAGYYQQDGIDAVTSLSNSAGALANTYTFDSFGKLTASTGTLTNPFQYTGREFDSESGLYYHRARYFDPNGGRFLSEDPLGGKGGINFYSYVENNPTNFVDPAGLAKTCVPLGDPLPFFWWTTYGPPVPVSGWRYVGYYIEGGAKMGNNVVNCVFQRQVQRQVTRNTYLLQEYQCDDDSISGCHTEYWWPVPNGRTIEFRVIKKTESGGVETYTERDTTRIYTIATDSSFWRGLKCLERGLPPQ